MTRQSWNNHLFPCLWLLLVTGKASNSSTPSSSLYYQRGLVMKNAWSRKRSKESCLTKRKKKGVHVWWSWEEGGGCQLQNRQKVSLKDNSAYSSFNFYVNPKKYTENNPAVNPLLVFFLPWHCIGFFSLFVRIKEKSLWNAANSLLACIFQLKLRVLWDYCGIDEQA